MTLLHISKRFLKEGALFLGLMGGMLVLSTLLGDSAFALDPITPEDNVVEDISGGATDIKDFAIRVLKFVLSFLGIVAVIMVIYGGFLYVTAAGDDDKVGTGKKIIMYSIIGIIIIMASFALINTVFQAGTGGETGGGV